MDVLRDCRWMFSRALSVWTTRRFGRPVGVAIDRAGALLVADDVGNRVWRVGPAAQAAMVWSVIGPTWPSVAALFTATLAYRGGQRLHFSTEGVIPSLT